MTGRFLLIASFQVVFLSPVGPDARQRTEEITIPMPGGVTMEFVLVQHGHFTMGSPFSEPGRGSDEGPQHQVTIAKGFYLGKHEVTQRQWQAVMGTSPWSEQIHVQTNPDHPAVYVSWNDTKEFIKKLNQAAESEVYRLPSEAEWEYACRGGTTTRWSFGDDESQLCEYAWYFGDRSRYRTKEVGRKQPNPWGLYDMHGNVYEWCRDWYGSYSSSAQVDPTGPASGSFRVARGGDFNSHAQLVRSAHRSLNSQPGRFGHIGFRLLRQTD